MPAFPEHSRSIRPLLGMLCGLLAYLCYSMCDILVSKLAAVYPPVQVAWTESLLALALLSGSVLLRRGLKGMPRVFQTRHPRLHVLRGTLFALGTLLVFTALPHVPLPNMYVIIFFCPLLGPILAGYVLKEPVGLQKLLVLLFGFGGIVVAMRPGAEGFNHYALLIFGAACLFGCNVVLNRYLSPKDGPAVLIFYPVTVAALLFALPVWGVFRPVESLLHLAGFAAAGVFLALALNMSAWAFRFAPAYLVAPCQFMQFVWGTLAHLLLNGKWPDHWALTGAAMIISSNILILILQKRDSAGERT